MGVPFVGQRETEFELIDGLQASTEVLRTLDAETIGTGATFADPTPVQAPAFTPTKIAFGLYF